MNFKVLLKPLIQWLRDRGSFTKTAIILGVDALVLIACIFLSYDLRISGFELPTKDLLLLYLVAPVLSIICVGFAGTYGSVSRAHSSFSEVRLIKAQMIAMALWMILLLVYGTSGFARSVVLIYFLLSSMTLIGLRQFASWVFKDGPRALPRREQEPVLVYGAGQEGMMLIDSLDRQGRYRAVGYLDTDYTLVGRRVRGLKVLPLEELSTIVERLKPRAVLIAKPNQDRATRRILVDKFLEHGLDVKTVPGIDEIVDGKIDIRSVRPVRLEDLLGRDPVPPNNDLMARAVVGKNVMVTGAGGSIGSELTRQVFRWNPAKLILVDNGEFALFEIHREIEGMNTKSEEKVVLMPILADVCDKRKMVSEMAEHAVEVVFHAAAYKHVRMVQENALAGIRNNIWGTLAVAEAAMTNAVGLFVLISTDKAVRPTSVMGATKRVAELIVQALASNDKQNGVFTIVRFGNVLGSTGSVIPLFQEQIMRGGPIWVTHKEVTRYFMLISEAAQLVVQAGAMAEPGEVFVLDMGETVKIASLAKTMIELAGMTVKSAENPGGDIGIEFIGLREGEKLHEELQIGRDVSPTPHKRIMRSNEFRLDWSELEAEVNNMDSELRSGNIDLAKQRLMRLALLGSEEQPQ